MSSTHDVVDREAWLDARRAFMEREKAFTKERDDLSRRRRELPWLEITKDYEFEGPDGALSLLDMFRDKSQLLVYHFMLGPGWDEGCPSCSFWADNYNGTDMHLAARDTSFAVIARATLPEIEAYKNRMEWTFDWYSSHDSDFNFDMGVSATQADIDAGTAMYNFGTQPAFGEESPGISCFVRDGDRIFLTYQTFARGLDMMNGAYHMLDLTAKGRDEGELPWPMAWLQRHDAYPS